MPGTTSSGCLTPSIGRVRVIEKSCVKFWTISQRGGDAARLAVGRADWLGRPASGRVDRAWGDESQVPQTRTPPRTPNARRTSMSWSAIGASPPRGSAWSCAGTATRSRVPARTSRSRRRLHARARAHAQHTHWPRSVLWQMLVSGLRGGVLPGLGVTAAPGLGLCWMHTCTALAALLHRAPCHVRRQQQGYTLFLASYTRSLCIKCGALVVKLPPTPPGWASGWVPVRRTDRCWRARSLTKCTQMGGVSATLAVARVMLRSPLQY